MKLYNRASSIISRSKIGKKFIRSQRYRTILLAEVSLLLNLSYAFYHGILGIMNISLWFISMFAFYGTLAAMRFSAVLCGIKKLSSSQADTEYFVMKLSGVLLIILSIVLTSVIYISQSQNIVAKHNEITMITIATYTFCRITVTILNAVKQHRNPSPLLSVIRSISCAEAAAFVLTLQRSMLVSFGEMNMDNVRLMNALTGCAVCMFILTLGIIMIVRGVKKGC